MCQITDNMFSDCNNLLNEVRMIFGLWNKLFVYRTAVRSVMRKIINAECSEINLVNGLSLVWLLGNRNMLLESATVTLGG